MRQFFFALTEAALASVFLVPLFFLLNRYRFRSRKFTLVYLLFAVYLCGVYAVAGLPHMLYFRFFPNFNFQPFLYMFSDLSASLLNVALFVPLGFFLALLWRPFRNPLYALSLGLCVSLAIEILQIFTRRATDVNDLITNTAGTFLGWALGFLTAKCLPGMVLGRKTGDLWVIFASSCWVMFFLQPFLSRLLRGLL